MGDAMTVTDHDLVSEADPPATWMRPQPLGVFDGPAGLLTVPPGPGVNELLTDLAEGSLPATWPDAAATFAHAAGDPDGSPPLPTSHSREAVLNRLVLSPTPEHWEAAEAAVADDPLGRAVVAAAAFASGLTDTPPEPAGLDGEFAVLALTVRAARAMEFKDAPGALRSLHEALPHAERVGPALHGRVLGMIAEHRFRVQGAVEGSLENFDAAISLLEGTDLARARAELQLERGTALHQFSEVQPHRLVDAIRSYQSALLYLSEENDPERFALANMNVGIAILSMPMTDASDQVKLGVAVQSLRAALRVYTQESHGYEWSSSQMNLANALQYLPSTHREDNLREAVDLYDEVLQVRSPMSDPLGYARVLANQANALAHLAAFDDAIERYETARHLFANSGEDEAVEVIDRQLSEITELQGASE
jgi:tetratricopeptide (TPR) repeat protein